MSGERTCRQKFPISWLMLKGFAQTVHICDARAQGPSKVDDHHVQRAKHGLGSPVQTKAHQPGACGQSHRQMGFILSRQSVKKNQTGL